MECNTEEGTASEQCNAAKETLPTVGITTGLSLAARDLLDLYESVT